MGGIRIGYTRKWLDLGGWQYSCLWKIGWYHSQKKTLKLIGIGHPSTWFQLVDQCWLGVIQFADPKRWWFKAVLTLPNHQLMNDRRLVVRHSKIRAQDRHFFEICRICLARCSHHSRILPGNLLFPPKYVVFTEVRVKFMWKKHMAQTQNLVAQLRSPGDTTLRSQKAQVFLARDFRFSPSVVAKSTAKLWLLMMTHYSMS
jgi:hypothetical protein